MAKLKIIQYPSPLLKRKAYKVTDFSDIDLQKIIDDMLETLCEQEHCAGLAATQLSIENPPSITVYSHPNRPEEIMCLINPEIIKKIGSQTNTEGCMSILPQILNAEVERATEVHVKAYDRQGNIINIEAKDLYARILQHEIDHLNGIIYLDRLSKLKRARIDKKIKKELENQNN